MITVSNTDKFEKAIEDKVSHIYFQNGIKLVIKNHIIINSNIVNNIKKQSKYQFGYKKRGLKWLKT